MLQLVNKRGCVAFREGWPDRLLSSCSVRLLAPAPVTNDRVTLTNRTMAQDDLVAVFGPAGSYLRQRDGDWDKEDRYLRGSVARLRPAKIIAGSGAPPPEEKSS